MQDAPLGPTSDKSSLWGTGRGQHVLGYCQLEGEGACLGRCTGVSDMTIDEERP